MLTSHCLFQRLLNFCGLSILSAKQLEILFKFVFFNVPNTNIIHFPVFHRHRTLMIFSQLFFKILSMMSCKNSKNKIKINEQIKDNVHLINTRARNLYLNKLRKSLTAVFLMETNGIPARATLNLIICDRRNGNRYEHISFNQKLKEKRGTFLPRFFSQLNRQNHSGKQIYCQNGADLLQFLPYILEINSFLKSTFSWTGTKFLSGQHSSCKEESSSSVPGMVHLCHPPARTVPSWFSTH